MHNLIIPLVTCIIAFAAIFGYQAYTDSQLDERIERAIIASLDGEHRGELGDEVELELTAMHEVNKGYGVCGKYTLASPTNSGGAFFYSKVSERVTLGVDSERYRANCSER